MDAKTAIGILLLKADPFSKKVITAFDINAARTAINTKALKKFNLELLEPCAKFLNIKLADDDGNKVFTKETLVDRIIHAIYALLPSTCSECQSQYTVEFEAEEKPLFHCYMCFQGSHNCGAVRDYHDRVSDDRAIAGSIWLCHSCLVSTNPVKPRKQKSKLGLDIDMNKIRCNTVH